MFTDSPFELVQAEEQHRGHAVVEQVFADVTSGPLLICRQGFSPRTPRGCPSRPWPTTSFAPPAPGQPALRQGPGRDHPPGPDRRRRPRRPARPRPPYPAPARGWHREHERPQPARLLAARRSGLTSPDPVRTGYGPRRPPRPRPRARNPGHAAEQASGRTPTPVFTPENSSGRNRLNELPELAGGSSLEGGCAIQLRQRRSRGPSGDRTLDERGLKVRRSAAELTARRYQRPDLFTHQRSPLVGRAGLEPAHLLLIRQLPSHAWPPPRSSESQHRTDDLRVMGAAL